MDDTFKYVFFGQRPLDDEYSSTVVECSLNGIWYVVKRPGLTPLVKKNFCLGPRLKRNMGAVFFDTVSLFSRLMDYAWTVQKYTRDQSCIYRFADIPHTERSLSSSVMKWAQKHQPLLLYVRVRLPGMITNIKPETIPVFYGFPKTPVPEREWREI